MSRRPSPIRLGLLSSLFCILAMVLAIASDRPAHAEDAEEAQPIITIDQGGLKAKTRDGQFKIKIGGRLHADGTLSTGDTAPDGFDDRVPPNEVNGDATDGTEIRRGRLVVKATVWEDWKWVGEVDFADNGTAVKDFNLGYAGFDDVTLTVGNQKQPFSLQLEMSSNDYPFVERGIDNFLVDAVLDRAIGGRVDANGGHWFVAAGVYGDGAEAQKDGGDEGWGAAGRAILAPIIEDDQVVHIGFRTAYRQPDGSIRYRDETTHMSNLHVVDTADLPEIDGITMYGPEAAVAFGPFSVFGEYNRSTVQRNGSKTVQFESGHIGATFSITGESRAASYKISSGEFKMLKPKENFSLGNGGLGAWEVASRFAYINLNDGSSAVPGSVNGGKEQAISTALNWYVNPNVRFMADWTHILQADRGSSSTSWNEITKEAQGMDMFTLRVQFNL